MFYPALALYAAGKPINKENIERALMAIGAPIDEIALDAVTLFTQLLEEPNDVKERPTVDQRIIRLLTWELAYRKA